MSSKIIEYDLRAPGRDYDALYDAIKEYGICKIHRKTFVKNFLPKD